jgi:transposase-like protein
MKTISARPRTITTAQRALIIQRVIVDDWTIGKAAATFDVPERTVAAWVLDYRRRGMASLRGASSRTVTAEFVRVVLSQPVQAVLRKLRKAVFTDATVQPLPLRQSNKDGPR